MQIYTGYFKFMSFIKLLMILNWVIYNCYSAGEIDKMPLTNLMHLIIRKQALLCIKHFFLHKIWD